MNVEAEIRDLKRRVGELEGSFGFLTQQVKAVHTDLLAFQEKTETRFESVENEIRAARQDIRSLRADLPGIVGGAVREALNEPRGKR
ncbi:MAG TPA: hypothetical protein VGD36_01770 [Xanthobacteraceae bacterium]|jgi:predicted  nucleic acid-binding Zn-ribbon protein